MRRVIVTGDDFGIAVSVNEAIEEACRRGILTTASLMVGAAAAQDAVRRARRLPTLRVGLHIVVVDGGPVLPPGRIPALVDGNGRFREGLVRAGFRYGFRRSARRQLAAEIGAQFAAFRRTGLPLDHVNAHHHMHLHPTVLGLLLEAVRENGLPPIRLPREPFFPSWRAAGEGMAVRFASRLFLGPWVGLMRRRLRSAGVPCNDYLFGMHDAGRMGPELVLRLIPRLPGGVSELHFHPDSAPGGHEAGASPGPSRELQALTSARVAERLRDAGVARVGFADLPRRPG
jgi:hopanoid biosynthesis associated protein HpnK